MKNTILFTIVVIFVLSIHKLTQAQYSGGKGTPDDPCQISTTDDWLTLINSPHDWSNHFILTTDLDFGGTILMPVGFSGNHFTGVFDGNDKVINNAVIIQPIDDNIGLFGYLGTDGQIHNLGVEDPNIVGDNFVGSLVGRNEGIITDCFASGKVMGGRNIGGLIGWNDGTITSSYATSTVNGDDRVGGLVGRNDAGTIKSCYANGVVRGAISVGILAGRNDNMINDCYAIGTVIGTDDYAGGLVGRNYEGTITSSYATGIVTGRWYAGGLTGENDNGTILYCYATGVVSGYRYIGGLMGKNEEGTITCCYASGTVTGDNIYIGGLVGETYYGKITSCYSTGLVRGDDYVGGLVGQNYRGKVIHCYSTGKTLGSSNVGGLCGSVSTGYGFRDTDNFWDTQTSEITISAMGIGKTTSQMKTLTTFTNTGWDFNEVWGIAPNQTYPYLAYGISADLNYDGTVNLLDWAIFCEQWLIGNN